MTKTFGNEQAQKDLDSCLLLRNQRTILLVGPDYVGKRSHVDGVLTERCGEDLFRADGTVDSMREAVRFASEATGFGEFRALLIDNADKASDPAKDAMLKLCEEPPGDLRVVLICSDEGLLPPALFSRIRRAIKWNVLLKEEMTGFCESLGPLDESAMRMSSGLPGLYSMISSNPGLMSVYEAITRHGEYDPLLTPCPELVKTVKPGASPDRDALCLIIRRGALSLFSSDRRDAALRFLRLSSILQKVPSTSVELHWMMTCVGP